MDNLKQLFVSMCICVKTSYYSYSYLTTACTFGPDYDNGNDNDNDKQFIFRDVCPYNVKKIYTMYNVKTVMVHHEKSIQIL